MEKTQMYIQKFSKDERQKIKKHCRENGIMRSKLYHDAIVAYVLKKEEEATNGRITRKG